MEDLYGSTAMRSPAPTTTSASSNSSLLAALNDEMFRRLAPAVAVLAALMVVGALGNVLVCYIFIRKLQSTSQNILLLSLGAFDLLSVCVGVPSEIVDIRHYYLYESAEACKAMRFLTTFPSLASILVLLVIAVDRYRKICKPLRPQIGVKHVQISVVVIVIVSLVFSVPALYIYGHRTLPTPVPGLFGCDCSVAEAFKNRPYPLVYEGMFIVAFFLLAVALVGIYARIWLETRRHIKYLKTHATFGTGMLEEATTTTSSMNYDDSSLENIADDNPRAKPRKTSSKKSLLKKRRSSDSRRHVKPSPKLDETKHAMLPQDQPPGSLVYPGMALDQNDGQPVSISCRYTCSDLKRMDGTDKDGPFITSRPDPKHRVLGDTAEAARALLSSLPLDNAVVEVVVLQESPKVGRKLLDSLPLGRSGVSGERALEARPAPCRTLQCSSPLASSNSNDDPSSDDHFQNNVVAQDVSQNESVGLSQTRNRKSQNLQEVGSARSILEPSRYLPGLNGRPQTADISNEGPPNEGGSFSSWNGIKTNSHPQSNHEGHGDMEARFQHTQCRESPCSNCSVDMSGRDQPRYIQASSQGCQCEPRENTLLVPLQTDQHNITQPKNTLLVPLQTDQHSITQSKKTLFFPQSDIKVEIAGNKTDQPVRFSSTNQMQGSNYSKSSQLINPTRRAQKALRGTRTTIIAFAITTGFIVSYLPHLTLLLLRSVKVDFEHDLDDVSLVFYNIFLRSYFVNNVVNVFVYGTMNLQFRSGILDLYTTIKCTRR